MAFLMVTCHDLKEVTGPQVPSHILYRSIGERIPLETGLRWMELYRKKTGQSRQGGSPYLLPQHNFSAMMNSVPDAVGVAFHYALDDNGTQHILAVPVGPTLNLWPESSSRMILDANTGEAIDEPTAQAWAHNFETANPVAIWFHFFGEEIFDEIMALSYFQEMEIEQALNDAGKPQLLLWVWNQGQTTGRTAGEPGSVYDASNPCPPCAVN